MLKTLTILAAVAAAGSTVAAPARFTDAQYIQASRCAALIGAANLGGGDTAAIDSVIRSQRGGRVEFIFDRADSARTEAEREARHAGADRKARLIAERDGVCQSYLPADASHTAGGAPATPNTAN